MSEFQKTTAIQLKDGSVPANEHTKVEQVVIVDENGTSLAAIIADFESRITTLEP